MLHAVCLEEVLVLGDVLKHADERDDLRGAADGPSRAGHTPCAKWHQRPLERLRGGPTRRKVLRGKPRNASTENRNGEQGNDAYTAAGFGAAA